MELIRTEITPHFKWEQFKHNGDQIGHCRNSKGKKNVSRMTQTFTQSMDHFYYTCNGPGKDRVRSSSNKSKLNDFSGNDNLGFTGGRVEELAEKPSMAIFNTAVKDMRKSNIHKKIKTAFADTSIRKRRMNPHDGEYDHDRRWDVNPFSRAARGISPVRSLKIFANISFSCGVGSDTIDRYGAMMAAICNLLESSGITVEIILQSIHIDSTDSGCFIDNIIIKKPGDYLPAASLIKAFSSNYYRRVLFTNTVMDVELQGKDARGGLSTPASFDEAVAFNKGELHIFSHSILDKSRETEFLTALEKSLGLIESDKSEMKKGIEDYLVVPDSPREPKLTGADKLRAQIEKELRNDPGFFRPQNPFYEKSKTPQPKKKKGGYKAPF